MPQTSENPRKMKKMSRVIWSYLGNKLLNPEVQFIASRSINTPPCDQGCGAAEHTAPGYTWTNFDPQAVCSEKLKL